MKRKLIKKFRLFKESLDNTVEYIEYFVELHDDDGIESLYSGTDYEEAQSIYGDEPDEESPNTRTLSLSKKTTIYEFLLTDEDIEDYPIEDYYDDEDVYKKIDYDFDDIESRTIEPYNTESDKLLYMVQQHYQDKYGGFKYHNIYVNEDDEDDEYKEPIGEIQLRITDHTGNVLNNSKNKVDFYISVVIADVDVTKQRFEIRNAFEGKSNYYELEFDSDDKFEDVIGEIDDLIDELSAQIITHK